MTPRRSSASRRPAAPRRVVLLGPQRHVTTLGRVVARLTEEGLLTKAGRIAAITAGWRERENEYEELDAELGRASDNLALYARTDEVVAADPELAAAHRDLQDRLKLLRQAYNARLAHLTDAWAELRAMPGSPDVLEAERAAALDAIRALDARHLERVGALRREFLERWNPAERPEVARHRTEIAGRVEDAELVVVAGGHVATLLNRLRWFGLQSAFGGRVVIAWSAGAMALGPRVVLFHDSPPWGRGNPEAFENGLGIYSGVLPFPHASERLRLEDSERLARLALRFAPDRPLLLDPGTEVEWTGKRWVGLESARAVGAGGRLEPMGAGRGRRTRTGKSSRSGATRG